MPVSTSRQMINNVLINKLALAKDVLVFKISRKEIQMIIKITGMKILYEPIIFSSHVTSIKSFTAPKKKNIQSRTNKYTVARSYSFKNILESTAIPTDTSI